MTRTVLLALVSLCLSCGSVSSGETPDAPTPVVDAACTATSCDNGQFCDGVETCTPDQGCQPGVPPDCGVDDVCAARSCDEGQDECVEQRNLYDIDWRMGDENGTITLECLEESIVVTDANFCSLGAALVFECALDSSGRLQARSRPEPFELNCLGTAGPWVTSDCSAAPSVDVRQLVCCFL